MFWNYLRFYFTADSLMYRCKTVKACNIVCSLISFPGAITLEFDWLKISWHDLVWGGATTFGKRQMSLPRSLSWASWPGWRIVFGRHSLPLYPSPLERPLVFEKTIVRQLFVQRSLPGGLGIEQIMKKGKEWSGSSLCIKAALRSKPDLSWEGVAE